jgi:HSP20 family protein
VKQAFERIILPNWEFGFDVSRTERGYVVDVPVPGLNASQLEMTLKGGIISISGKDDRRNFSRSFSVPEDVDPEKIEAQVADGTLTIALERRPPAQPRKINVK